jgi:hypothetical protein
MSWLPRTAAAMLEGGRRGGGEEEENECEWAGMAAADREMERRGRKMAWNWHGYGFPTPCSRPAQSSGDA